MENQLAQFNLDQRMNQITFVTDRGSNFLKAFRLHKALYCVAHRLNNILKRCFLLKYDQEEAEVIGQLRSAIFNH